MQLRLSELVQTLILPIDSPASLTCGLLSEEARLNDDDETGDVFV